MGKVLVVDDTATTHDIFEVIAVTDTAVRARAPFRFEIGEEVRLRIAGSAEGSSPRDVTARVRAYDTDGVTELEIITP